MQQSKQVLKWQAEARKQGEVEGKKESKVEWLLRTLQRRTGKEVPPDLATTIRATADLTTLDHWFDVADGVSSFDEFCRRVNLQNGAG